MVIKTVAIIFLSTYLYLYTDKNIYTCKIEENVKVPFKRNTAVGWTDSEYTREINVQRKYRSLSVSVRGEYSLRENFIERERN